MPTIVLILLRHSSIFVGMSTEHNKIPSAAPDLRGVTIRVITFVIYPFPFEFSIAMFQIVTELLQQNPLLYSHHPILPFVPQK